MELPNLSKTATNKAENYLTLIQQPAADWEHLHEGPELLLLLQQVLQILTAPPQSNPVPSNQHRKKDTIQTTIQEHQKQGTGYSKKATIFQESNRGAILPGMFW